jgi:DNA repair protein RadC
MDFAGQLAAETFQRESEARLTSAAAAAKLFRPLLAGRSEEHFAIAYCDTRLRLIKIEAPFRGSIDYATVAPRVVAERALRYGAAAVMLAHNHPSGDPAPSLSDLAITNQLRKALALIDVRLLDHLVIGEGGYRSVVAEEKLSEGEKRADKSRLARAKKAKRAKSGAA